MRKSIEMRKDLDALKSEIDGLQKAGKVSEAYAKLDSFNRLKEQVAVQEALEADEDNSFTGKPLIKLTKADATMTNRIFNKMLLSKKLTDEENEVVTMAAGTPGQVGATDAKGGYLLPAEQIARLLEYRRGLVTLKPLCEIIPVTRRSGSFPTVVDDSSTLTNFDELNEITSKDIDFSNVAFKISDYGEIIPVSNTLLEDIDIDLLGFIGRRFNRKAVRTENTSIMSLMPSTATPITNYKGIKNALNVMLDPALADGASIITNQDGFEFLDEVEADGKPLLQPVLTDPTKRIFSGHNIIVLSNEQLATASNTVPFYVGNMFDYAKFFDRKQVSLAVSTEAGFTKNATLLRVIERYDVKVGDSAAMVKLTYTKA